MKMRTIRIAAGVLLLISLFCTVDLGLNVLYNTMPGFHDGSYAVHSVLHTLFRIFGDSLWSFDRFFTAFERSAWISYGLFVVNGVLHFRER